MVVGFVLALLLTGQSAAVPPPSLAPAPGVKEPFFALMLGMFIHDQTGRVTSDQIRAEIARAGKTSRIPFGLLHSVSRQPSPARSLAHFDVYATRPIRVDLPYDILGYNPGTVRGSQVLRFEEWDFGDVKFHRPPKD